MKWIVEMCFQYCGNDKKVETEMFIHSIYKTIMWENWL